MTFSKFVYGNISAKPGELRTGNGPTDLVYTDKRGVDIYGDNDTLLLIYNSKQEIFVVTNKGFTRQGIFKEYNEEDGLIVLENGNMFSPKDLAFLGELD